MEPNTSPVRSDEILERLLSLHPKVIDLSLERLERLLAAIDHPEKKLPPVVHVAGTNAKGSVCAFLRAGLSHGGARAHAYSSPHLARFHERIRLAGDLIEEDALSDLLAECERANGAAPITFFEITTAAALLAFSRVEAEWLVLEVGLGGRLDATNVIDAPAVTVITPVSLDHQQFLGDTIEEIAGEKAGILKAGVPCVVGAQEDAALDVIHRAAERIGAPLSVAGQDWRVSEENGRLVFEDNHGLFDLPKPRLFGRHQVENAGIAVATLRALGFEEPACAAAMTEVDWPARLQRLKSGPLIEAVSSDTELWLDGGHNPAAGEAVAAFFGQLEERSPAPLYVICGMLNTKDPDGYLRPFDGLARRVFTVSIPGEANTLPAEDVAQAAVRVGLSAQAAGSVEGALRTIMAESANDFVSDAPRILICGSLYLAGRVLRENA
ncbi:MAG: folylpolyglutamate synthase/dihydrofolate synthase family protein [Pseudomonadota bacterium]